ncbi:MAG: ATP-binding protein [Bacillota bacterium]
MFKSIKWRFSIIYIVLIFIALIVSGVFIIKSFEEYHLQDAQKKLDNLSDIISSKVNELEKLDYDKLKVIVNNQKTLGFKEEIYIIDSKNEIVASSTDNKGVDASKLLDLSLLVYGENEKKGKTKTIINNEIKTLDRVIPIENDNGFLGLIYIRYNLQSIYEMLNKTTMIIVKAIIIAIIFTIIFSVLISRTISGPIEKIAKKAVLMSKGNYDQKVEIESNDEIGELGKTFNHLASKLNYNINQVYREKNKIETIVESMHDGLIATNLTGETVHINSKAKDLLSLDNNNLDKYKEILSLESIILSQKYFGSKVIEFKEKILKLDYLPFKGENNENQGLVFVLRDITKREELDRMRKEFVANVSHELKTPLTSIMSYSETLINDDYPKDLRKKFLGVINNEADRMTRLVRDLLKLSNFDKSKINLNLQSNNIDDLINSILLKLKPSYDNKNQKLNYNKEIDDPIFIFDYDKIEQVIINIMTNAIKYTHENGKIDVFLKETDENYQIIIKDNGMGIPKKDLKHIFERFYRVDKARSRKLGGTGLGLSIANEIIKTHNGEINIDSEVDKGTNVNIKLPKTNL